MRLPQALAILLALWRSRRLSRRLKTRADVDQWQSAAIRRWLAEAVPRVGFYRQRPATRLADLPIIDKALQQEHFEDFNGAGIDAARGWRIMAGEPAPPGLSLGTSTGTSGNRGLYVVSDSERFQWLGTMLAKTLPGFPLQTARVALILPMRSALYATAGRSRRLDLRFHDLHDGLEAILPRLVREDPDTLIAPPRVLRWLAENDSSLRPLRVFSGAEVLDALDRQVIERRYGVVLREIYMATEGLLGVACPLGTLHLAEDVVHFEFERPDPASDLVTPIITDFTRRTQIMARYRMNDLLRLSPHACPCGSPLQPVAEVVGRADDMFRLRAPDGRTRIVTPDILRNAIVDADRAITDFRLVQTGPDAIRLTLAADLPSDCANRARTALVDLFVRLELAPELTLEQGLSLRTDRKLRRVERLPQVGREDGG